MDIQKIALGALSATASDALVVPCFEGEKPSGSYTGVDEVFRAEEFTGKPMEIVILHQAAESPARRVVLAGLGKKESPADARKLAGAVVRTLKAKGVKSIVWDAAQVDASLVVEGTILGDWEPDVHKSKKDTKHIDSLTVATDAADSAIERGRVLAESQNFTRDLVNEPANLLPPLVLAEKAAAMAREEGLECEILDDSAMAGLGMGALLGVAQGSENPPALIVIRYRPAGAASAPDHLGLVGKGVTFDTGGVSIKPADGMEKMKYDMAGGAAVIGAMRAIARLKPSIAVTAFIPAVENMVGGNAQRPGDIVTTMAGKTVEVLNTDAEGRLILIDAITYAKQLGCNHLVDAATLTGAIVVALGYTNVGAFTNDDAMLARVMKAAKAQGEKLWQMPLDDEYKDLLKSAFADLPNIGGRAGGSISAAMFLKEFADPTPWVHLDIAGTAWIEDSKPFIAKGPSGVGVRTFVELALGW